MMTKIHKQPGKVVCLIQVGKQWVIAENDREKTSPRLVHARPDGTIVKTIHAEARALKLAARIGGKIKRVIVLRWTKGGRLSMAKPCAHCATLLSLAGVNSKKISWSNEHGEIVS